MKSNDETKADLSCRDIQRENAILRRELRQLRRIAQESEAVHQSSKRSILSSYRELEDTVDALKVARQRAEDANHARGRFVATISHEMRTPLNGILGTLELFERGSLTSENHQLVEIMHRSARSLLSLINDVLDFSKIEAQRLTIERAPFDIHDCVQSICDLELGVAQQKGICIETDVRFSHGQEVVGDSARLRQVLLNLVDNAVKFTAEGTVSISLRPSGDGDGVHFAIADTGIGISEEGLSSIFAPFCQADDSTTRRYGGTGLGLSICSKIVEHMGGRLGVESAPGIGTTFFFEVDLPLHHPTENATQEVQEPHRGPATAKPAGTTSKQPGRSAVNVLVVDDIKVNRVIATKMLQRLGHTAVAACDGFEALQLCERSKTDFDLILMDCSMPVMDGFESTRRLRALGVKTPIVALTANVMEDDRQLCKDAGMEGFLSKPLQLSKLGDTLAAFSEVR